MAYDITLTDTTTTAIMPLTEVPLTITTVEGAIDVEPLSLNVYTDFITQKRIWAHTWAYMTEQEYISLVGFYNRQFTLFKYPTISITNENTTNVSVRMVMTPKLIIDNCGTVQDVSVSWRETRQLGS